MGEKEIEVKKEGTLDEKKTVDADNTKKDDHGPTTVVLKLDLHCAGCAKKVKKSIQHIEGVENVKADFANNKLTITGKVDPVLIKERVEFKTKKKVEIISPKPKNDDGDVKKDDVKPPEAKSDAQKPKEPQSATVVLKIPLHCDGCSQKIKRIISKIDGVELVKPESTKNLVTVKGTMNIEELVLYLKNKLKRNVEIAPTKKENDNKGSDQKLDKNKTEEGEKKTDAGKSKDEGDNKKKNEEAQTPAPAPAPAPDDEVKMTNVGADQAKNIDHAINKFEYYRPHNAYVFTMPAYNQNYHNQDYGISVFSTQGYAIPMEYPHRAPPPPSPMSIHDPRASESDLFSAENPNACSIM
ncbi:hypothetical protein R6Q57_023766 [Mikania cordata]